MKSIATPTSTKSGSPSSRSRCDENRHHSSIPSVQLTSMQTKEYRHLAQEIVTKTLYHETKFRYQDNETLDEKDWKFVRSKERMRVYKRMVPSSSGSFLPSMTSTHSSSSNNNNNSNSSYVPLLPMVLGVGCMEGKLEDALYGVHHKTTEEMRSVTSFLNKNHKDAAVLANVVTGTPEDPFRYLGLKWRVVQTPGVGSLIRKRDVSTLEHLGIGVDEQGNRYGFHLMKSVDLPDFPAFANDAVVRAQVMLCCIYRQITPTLVGMYCKAIFDPSGDMMDFVSYFTAAELVLGISKALECAAAKRLTQLALKNSVEIPASTRSTWASQSSRFTQSSSSVFGRSSEDNSAIHHKDKDSTPSCCSVCRKKRSPFFPLGSHTRACRLCDKLVCAKCCVKTVLFARPQNVKVLCCKACVIESRSLKVDPRQPLPELGAHDGDDDY